MVELSVSRGLRPHAPGGDYLIDTFDWAGEKIPVACLDVIQLQVALQGVGFVARRIERDGKQLHPAVLTEATALYFLLDRCHPVCGCRAGAVAGCENEADKCYLAFKVRIREFLAVLIHQRERRSSTNDGQPRSRLTPRHQSDNEA